MRTFTFHIAPWVDTSCWREIVLTEDQSLDSVHAAIQDAFDLDDDHLYAFFLNNRAWDRVHEYGGPEVTAPQRASVRLGDLPLKMNKRFLYLFDFGDELRHEVKVVGMGTTEEGVSYPRIVAAEGTSPSQRWSMDEDLVEAAPDVDGADLEGRPDPEMSDGGAGETRTDRPPVSEALAGLVPEIQRHLDAHYRRRYPDDVGEGSDVEASGKARPDALENERDSAMALLEHSGGDPDAISAVLKQGMEAILWSWLEDLPFALSQAGLAEDAAELASRVREACPRERLQFQLPVILARANRPNEAREELEANLGAYPDDPAMLKEAGAALRELGDAQRAEACFREALTWMGSDYDGRDGVLLDLMILLESEGRANALEELKVEESKFRRGLMEDRQREMGLWVPKTVRRASPKVGRNAPCPCGSGKKYKKCCGKDG